MRTSHPAGYRLHSSFCRAATASALLVAALLFSGCATAQSPNNGNAVTGVPDWVTNPPTGDNRYDYFVGLASDSTGDVAKAEEQATNSLIAEIVRFLDVRITADTTAEARTTLQEFQATVVQQVRQTGSAQVKGFRVADRYVQRQGGRVTVYILGRYDHDALLAEQQRLSALFQEQIAAVSGPEREGDQLLAVGREYEAVRKYVEAAAAAAGSGIDNADVKFERNINKARSAVSDLRISKLNDNLSATLNEPFSEDFLAKVETSVGGVAKPVADVPLLVSYRELGTNGRTRVATTTIRTNSDGVARFTHPIPTIVGGDTLTMRLDLSASLSSLDSVPGSMQSLVGGLRDAVASRRVSFSYSVISRAVETPVAVVVLDTDNAGNPTNENGTASGIESELSAQGFTIPSISFDPQRLKGRSDAEIIAGLRASMEQGRAAYGVVSIQEFTEGDGYVVKVGGTVKVADLSSGRILYSRSMFTLSRGDNAASAISAAFRTLGRNFGQDIARTLP
ncbi:hypothetical protein [Salinispira pacifica]